MAALTLFESSKLHSGDEYRQGVIETIGTQGGSVLSVLPFIDIEGNSYSYNREGMLPTVGFRGINQDFDTSVGVLNPQSETLTIFGGNLDVDKFIVRTQGEDVRTTHEMMKLKAMALTWNANFFKGDSTTDPRSFDGLQKRLVVGGTQVIDNGSSSGGDALSLAKLDEMIDAVEEPTHLFMNRAMLRRLSQAAKKVDVAGDLQWEKDDFGGRVARYNDLPIIAIDKDASNELILPFTEANPGGGAAASTSIYCVSLGDGKLVGLQNGTVEVEDLGLLDGGSVYRTNVEHYQTIALLTDKAAARLRGITDAPVVA